MTGLLLAAGAGRRMGGPKALLRTGSGGETLLSRAVRALADGGCGEVVVVLGAEAAAARALLEGLDARPVESPGWEDGMGASLSAGLASLSVTESEAALVSLVDLPDVGADVMARVLAAAAGDLRGALVRAAYRGVPGHPVVIGRAHWGGAIASATGDRGARDYLAAHPHTVVECGDLASGRDVDTPDQL